MSPVDGWKPGMTVVYLARISLFWIDRNAPRRSSPLAPPGAEKGNRTVLSKYISPKSNPNSLRCRLWLLASVLQVKVVLAYINPTTDSPEKKHDNGNTSLRNSLHSQI
jgi:hypothetical protein